MYECHFHLYLAGHPCHMFEVIKAMPSLNHFTHLFLESDEPEEILASKADVIVANLSDMEIKKALQIFISGKKKETQIILLADKEQMQIIMNESFSADIYDIWITPMSEEEVRFRFLRFQQACKIQKDFWQTSHFFEATINNIPNLIWYKDKNGIHEKVNDSFCRTVNKTKQQVEGRGHAYIWDVEQDDPVCIESEREVMNTRQTFVSEETIKTGDGMRTLTTYKSPLYNLDGSVMGTVGVAIDVTQERAYEQEIIQKNQTLETIFTTIDCGMICHTADGKNILSINKAALKILGYDTQEELQADGFDMIAQSVLDEDKAKLRECIKTLKKPGDNVSVEYCVLHKDGELLHVMGNIKLFEEKGELLYQRFLLDCTAQKLQEKKNEQRQMELVQALSIDFNLVCFVDPFTGKVNPIRNEIFELGDIFKEEIDLKESMEKYIQKYVHEEDKEMLREAVSLDTLIKNLSKKNLYYVNYRKRKGEEIRYFQMKAVGAGIGDGTSGIVLGFRSVDGEIRREMEQKSLLENALIQANNASKAKSIFLSNMSHDIRTPMNAIVGFTNLAIARIEDKTQVAEYLKKIKTSGNHLLSLINDVLDMSRIESGKIRLEEEPCSLSDILYNLRNIIQADVNAKQLQFQIETAGICNEYIYCDKLRLNQVFLNLLSNAVKYTEVGGSVHMQVIERTAVMTGYAGYEFSIKDNGIGMSQEFVEHIFEPFEREKNSTISGIQGTGLGMAITKNIVDMMNGTIRVQSEEGKGSEFIVSFTFRLCSEIQELEEKSKSDENRDLSLEGDLPIYGGDAPVSAHSDLSAGEKSLETEDAEYHSKRILLAEDVELNQEIAVAILEDAGFTVDVADNGKIAVDMIKKAEPEYYQAVLMDVQMPVMNGYEATKEIRSLENEGLAAIPIIAMTANAFEEDRQEALKYGMNGHIAKPIDTQNLFETLDSVL